MLLTMLLFILLVPSLAEAQTAFRNPDGPPGAVAIEPFFAYLEQTKATVEALNVDLDREDFDLRNWSYGIGIIFPASERLTIRTSGALGHTDSQETRELIDVATGQQVGEVFVEERRPDYSFGVSLRFWLGSRRN